MDINAALDAPSGGGRPRTTAWGRGENGGLSPRAIIYTGNPPDFTANLTYPLTSETMLKRLNCPFNIRARQYCAPNRSSMLPITSPGMRGLLQTTVTKYGFDSGLAMMDGQGKDILRTVALDASLEAVWTPVAHDDISNNINDVKFNAIIRISAETCQGACGLGTTEEDAWIAVTAKDSTPTYGGSATPWLYWTVDRWVTRNAVRIGAFLSSDARDVVLAGQRVIVFSDTKAPVYAQLSSIYNGVVDPNLWAVSSGFSSISGSNFPTAAVAVDASTILCVGAGGRIWLSTDGGFTFTLIYDTGVLTSNNLNDIDAQVGGNAFVGGNSGTFIRLSKTPGASSYTGTVIVVKDAALNVLSSNINCVLTPSTRGDEVYLGTAGGEIWRSRNITQTLPLWFNMSIPNKGVGSIVDMDGAGYQGNTLFITQNDVNGNSRILRDFSGGNLGNDVEIIGDFVTPGNFGINAFATANVNMGVGVGNVHNGSAWVDMVRPAQ